MNRILKEAVKSLIQMEMKEDIKEEVLIDHLYFNNFY